MNSLRKHTKNYTLSARGKINKIEVKVGVQRLLRKGVSKKLVPGKERFQEKA